MAPGSQGVHLPTTGKRPFFSRKNGSPTSSARNEGKSTLTESERAQAGLPAAQPPPPPPSSEPVRETSSHQVDFTITRGARHDKRPVIGDSAGPGRPRQISFGLASYDKQMAPDRSMLKQGAIEVNVEGSGVGGAEKTEEEYEDVAHIRELREQGHTAADLRFLGTSAGALREAGFSARELRSASFDYQSMVMAGYSQEAMKLAGFGQATWSFGGYTWSSMIATPDDGTMETGGAETAEGRGRRNSHCMTGMFSAADFAAANSPDVSAVWLGPTFDEWNAILAEHKKLRGEQPAGSSAGGGAASADNDYKA